MNIDRLKNAYGSYAGTNAHFAKCAQQLFDSIIEKQKENPNYSLSDFKKDLSEMIQRREKIRSTTKNNDVCLEYFKDQLSRIP